MAGFVTDHPLHNDTPGKSKLRHRAGLLPVHLPIVDSDSVSIPRIWIRSTKKNVAKLLPGEEGFKRVGKPQFSFKEIGLIQVSFRSNDQDLIKKNYNCCAYETIIR
jgi:hypothetical protein